MHTCDSGISLKLCNILNFISVLKASVKLLLGLSHTLAVQIEPESSVDSYTKLEYLHLLLFLMIPPTLFVLKGHFRPVILAVEETEFLKVWLLDQQHHLGTYSKCKFSPSTPDLRNQRLWKWNQAICVLTNSPGTVRNSTCRSKLIMDQQFLIRVQPNTLRTSVH